MLVIRPVAHSDLADIVAIADRTSFGLTTLPRDEKLLEARILDSEQAFATIERGKPSGQAYLLVLEDLEKKKVVGTSGIVSKVGGFEPFYAYRIEMCRHESLTLNIRKDVPTLHLVAEHDGPSEIGSLFLDPDYRHAGNGRLLSLSRFLMMAEFPQLFDDQVIAEMRGVITEEGQSPFWDALGKHFFELDFPKADYLSIVNKEFIGDLMPVHPIYIPLLPQQAQDVIGEVHENTRPARRLLETEGFQFQQMIDIFEAGPILHCPVPLIRTVRTSRRSLVIGISEEIESSANYFVSNTSEAFRAVQAPLKVKEDGIEMNQFTAKALNVNIGETIRFVTPRP